MCFLKKIFTFLILSIGLISCEKDIDLSLVPGESLIVVEGVIETGQLPYVTLTNSIGFFSKIDLSKIAYIKNASISIEDLTANKSITLKEYNIDTVIDGTTFSFTLYAPNILDPNALNFVGEVNHFYKLNIITAGKDYHSITQIPSPLPIDSVWTEPVNGKEDSFSVLKVLYADPDTFGNSVRLETKINRYKKNGDVENFFTAFNSVLNDNVINGTRIPFEVDLGYDKSKTYSDADFETINYLRKGDTITLKWSAIDKQVFNFWETLAFSAGAVGNPFASPTKVQSNIPGALGIWGGYSSLYYTVIDSL